ncbi:MAG TPA: metalloregulator ArsR/SmtB family transcription factor [Gemmatimonadaceae bacterium]|nr:metalloregulator ArsR/SmtB family transcription factor [Gemmatimonadaceae bacterium]
MVYYGQNSSALDTTFGALAAPTRRAILLRLEREVPTIAELASQFTMSLPAVSKHVRVLEHAGLATVYREGRSRRVRLRAEPLREAAELLERYRAFWSQQLDELASYLADQPSPDHHTRENDAWQEHPRPPHGRHPSKGGTHRHPRPKKSASTRSTLRPGTRSKSGG